MLSIKLSEYANKSLIPSAINEMTAEFAGDFREGIDINLGVGYVNDKTIPVDEIGKAYAEIIADPRKYRNALNYGGGEGSPNLRNSIRDYHEKYSIGGLKKNDLNKLRILIGANGATSLLDSFADILEPGCVITADPYYYIYTETLKRRNFELIPVDEDECGIRIDLLEKKLNAIDINKISFFYIVTVNNPTSTILSNERREKLVNISIELSEKTGRKIPIIFDKAYEDIIHDPGAEKPVSAMKFNTAGNIFEIGTLSKILAPALRIGYLFSTDNKVCDLLVQKTSDIGFSASLINQEIASWLLDNHIQIQKEKVNAGYREKAVIIKRLIEYELGKYLKEIRGGSAGFYFYLTLNNIETHKESKFFKFLSRKTGDPETDGKKEKNPRLIYIPGKICSSSENAKCQLRLSYGFEDIDVFAKAIALIKDACRYATS